jgi:lipopolysaccharide transport protein LptA
MRPLLFIAALALSAPAADRLRGEGKAVEMTAQGGLRVDLKAQTGKAKGDVVIRREDIVVCCDEAEASFSGDKIERVECKGRVVIVRPDGTRARADVAIFDARADTVTLSGGARLRSTDADLEGDAIIYDIAKDHLEVTGKGSKFRFAPGQKAPLDLGRACPP